MIQPVRVGLVLAAVLPLAVGCATKEFVREEIQKSEVKVDREIGRIESTLGQEKSRVDGIATQVGDVRASTGEAAKRVEEAARRAGEAAETAGRATSRAEEATAAARQAMTRADEAGGTASRALSRADEAAGMAGQALNRSELTDARLTRLWAARNRRVPAGTLVVAFAFDKWELDDGAQTALLDLVKQLRENPELVVTLEGYTDNVGPAAYNVQLAQRRADAVRRFLVERGVEVYRVQSIGLGPVQLEGDNRTSEGRAKNRRVVVKLFAPPVTAALN